MAFTVTDIGEQADGAASTATTTCTLTGTAAVGDLVIVEIGANIGSIDRTTISANFFTCSQTETWNTLNNATAGSFGSGIYWTIATTALGVGDTVAYHKNNNATSCLVVLRAFCYHLTDGATWGTRDKGVFANSQVATGAGPFTETGTTSGTLAQAHELTLGYFETTGAGTYSTSGAWTQTAPATNLTGSSHVYSVYQEVSATTAVAPTITMTGGTAGTYDATTATFTIIAQRPFTPARMPLGA